jgi:ABC-type histidine transport system ATPase subunit
MAVTHVELQGTHMEYASRERFGGLSLKTTGGRFLGLGLKTSSAVSVGIGGGTWHHCKTCVEAKLSHEGRVAVGSTEIELDHNALRLGSSL